MYSIQKLSSLALISTRTLRYYDEIGLLKPAYINESGYRMYEETQVNRLQHILFYKELGLPLGDIKDMIDDPSFNEILALQQHRQKLLEKKQQLDLLILNVEKTIAQKCGGKIMSTKEKFEGFKEKLVVDNEVKYGKEIREKYGDTAVEASYEKIKNMTEKDYQDVEELGQAILTCLYEIMDTEQPDSELAQKLANMHHQWLMFYWKDYNKAAHAGLADMYIADERFTMFYDKEKPGAAQFLRDAIIIYTQE